MVGDFIIKIKLTAFCMHLTLFNQLQVDVYVEFCYLSVNGADLSELKSKSVFTVYLDSK